MNFCLLKIPPLIKERTLVDVVNPVLFYLPLLGYFYAVAKYNFCLAQKLPQLTLFAGGMKSATQISPLLNYAK